MITVTDPSLPYSRQLEEVMDAYTRASEGRTVHFRRFFLSDGANQAAQLETALAAQPPLIPTALPKGWEWDGANGVYRVV